MINREREQALQPDAVPGGERVSGKEMGEESRADERRTGLPDICEPSAESDGEGQEGEKEMRKLG